MAHIIYISLQRKQGINTYFLIVTIFIKKIFKNQTSNYLITFQSLNYNKYDIVKKIFFSGTST